MIVATGNNFEIGKGNSLLWNLPEDLRYFKQQTLNQKVVMGSNTFKSLPFENGLPKRENYVITRDLGCLCNVTTDVKFISALDMQYILNSLGKHQDYWIIGGAQIYDQFIDFVDEIHWTCVEKEYPEADVFLTKNTANKMTVDFQERVFNTEIYDGCSDTYYTIKVLDRIKED